MQSSMGLVVVVMVVEDGREKISWVEIGVGEDGVGT